MQTARLDRLLARGTFTAAALFAGAQPMAQTTAPAAASAPESAPRPSTRSTAEGRDAEAPASDGERIPIVRIQGQRERDAPGAEPVRGYLPARSNALGPELPLQQLPVTVNTITADLLRDLGATRLSDLAGRASGLLGAPSEDTPEDTLVTRGFEADVMTNGLIFSVARPMPDNIERIEITKGPADTEYGIAEPGGTINMITKKPQREFEGQAYASVGDYGYRKLGLDVTGAINASRSLQGRLIAARELMAHWRQGRPNELPRSLLAPSLNWDYGGGGSLLLEAQRYTQNDPLDRGIVYLEGAYPGGFAPRDWSFHQRGDRYEQKSESVDLVWSQRLTPGLDARVHWQRARESYRIQQFRDADNEPGGVLYNPDGRSWTGVRALPIEWADWGPGVHRISNLQMTLRGRRRIADAEHVLTLGAARQSKRLSGTAVERLLEVDNTIDIFTPDHDQRPNIVADNGVRRTLVDDDRRVGAFLQWLAMWTPRWRSVVGVRRERDTERQVTALNDETPSARARDETVGSWRLAASFDLDEQHTVYAGYANAREPQDGSQRSGTRVPALHARNFELGLKSTWRDGELRWTNALFRVSRDNESIPDPANTPTEDFVIPVGKVRVSGFESELLGRVGPHWDVAGGIAYLDASIARNSEGLAGKRFANTPRWQLSALVGYRFSDFGLPALRTTLGLAHVSKRYGNSDNNIALPGYTIVNAGLSYDLTAHATFGLAVSNLFDRTYYVAMHDEPVRPGPAGLVTVGDRRLVQATFSFKFD